MRSTDKIPPVRVNASSRTLTGVPVRSPAPAETLIDDAHTTLDRSTPSDSLMEAASAHATLQQHRRARAHPKLHWASTVLGAMAATLAIAGFAAGAHWAGSTPSSTARAATPRPIVERVTVFSGPTGYLTPPTQQVARDTPAPQAPPSVRPVPTPTAPLARAFSLLASDPDTARTLFATATSRTPGDPTAWLGLANALVRLGRTQEGRDALCHALSLDTTLKAEADGLLPGVRCATPTP